MSENKKENGDRVHINGESGEEMFILSDDIMTVEFDDGTVTDCIIDFIFPVKGMQYIALHPEDFEGDEDDCPVFFYRYSEDEEGNPILDVIEDDDELEAVLDRFDELLDEVEFDELVPADED